MTGAERLIVGLLVAEGLGFLLLAATRRWFDHAARRDQAARLAEYRDHTEHMGHTTTSDPEGW